MEHWRFALVTGKYRAAHTAMEDHTYSIPCHADRPKHDYGARSRKSFLYHPSAAPPYRGCVL